MKTKIFTFILICSLYTSFKAQTSKTTIFTDAKRSCGTAVLPSQYELFVDKWLNNTKQLRTQAVNYTLPVIVHVINAGEAIGVGANISNAQVLTQIDVLNADFSGLNADSVLIPSVFKPVFAHSGINFCLAQTDTNGVALSEPGVHRVNIVGAGGIAGPYTKDYIDTIIKPYTIWNPNKYLNLWCLDLGNSLLGYATFPDPASTGVAGLSPAYGNIYSDGVVIKNTAFGTVGPLLSAYDKGRTATHEVGHWLGLRHIWGDGTVTCGATDYCNDTPPAEKSNSGCQIHPYNLGVCAGNTTGEMFMNHMDYSNDTCLHMFTNDQKARMVALLNGSPMRANLVASTKCNIATNTIPLSNLLNIKLFPNPNNGEFTITLDKPNTKTYIEIFDNVGRLISHSMLTEAQNKINLNHLAVGIYQVRVTQDGNTVYRNKLIKN